MMGITVLNFGVLCRKLPMLFWVVAFNGAIGVFESMGTPLS